MKLSFICSALVDSIMGGKGVYDDHCLAGRLVWIERGVRRDAFLRHGRPCLARQARYHWISEARQLTAAIFAPAILRTSKRCFARLPVHDCGAAIVAVPDYSVRLNRARNRSDIS